MKSLYKYGEDGEYAINVVKPGADKLCVWMRAPRRRELKDGWQITLVILPCAVFVWFALAFGVRWYCLFVLWLAGLLGV